jgi:prolyl-tRNA synthetase
MVVTRRDRPHKEKEMVSVDAIAQRVESLLGEMQQSYYAQALELRERKTEKGIKNLADLKAFFTPKNIEKPEIHGGFALAKWSGEPGSEKVLEDLKVTVRCVPLEQSGTQGTCVLTGKPATLDAIFAKSY